MAKKLIKKTKTKIKAKKPKIQLPVPTKLNTPRDFTPQEDILIYGIARVCHEVNRGYCESRGDDSQVKWEQAPSWQKESAIAGVKMHIANPDATPEDSHNSWLEQKRQDGWKYGLVKDVDKKEHPCFLEYHRLPIEQQSKDYIFRAVVHALWE